MLVYHERVQEGCFVYQVIRKERVYIQPAPLIEDEEDEEEDEDDDHFETNELVAVDMIQPCSTATFVRLADQSGWLVAESDGEVFLEEVPVSTGKLITMYADTEQTVRRHPMDDTSEFLSSEEDDTPLWKLQPMQKIYCDASVRHPVTGIRFFRIQGAGSKVAPATPGWVFEKSQTNEYKLLPANKISTGLFAYRALCTLVVREQPDCTESSMTAFTLEEGNLVVADLVRESPVVGNGNGPFFRLSDGSGWLFQKKLHDQVMEPVPIRAGHWILTVLNDPEGLYAVKQPVSQKKALQTRLFDFGSVVECDRWIENQGVNYYRVIGSDGEWLYDKHRGRRTLSLLQQVGEPATLSTSWDIQFVRGILATASKNVQEVSHNEDTQVLTLLVQHELTVKLFCATRTIGVFFRHEDKPHKRFEADATVEQLINTVNRNLEETISYFAKEDDDDDAIVAPYSHEGQVDSIKSFDPDGVGEIPDMGEEKKEDGEVMDPVLQTAAEEPSDHHQAQGISAPAAAEKEEEVRTQLLQCEAELAAVLSKRSELMMFLKQFDTERDEAAFAQYVRSQNQQQKHKDQYHAEHHSPKSPSRKGKLKTRRFKQVTTNRSSESNSMIDKSVSGSSSSISSKPLLCVPENSPKHRSENISVRSNSSRAQIYCRECHKQFSGKYSRDLHCRHVHKLFCEKCDKIFPSFLELEAHREADSCQW